MHFLGCEGACARNLPFLFLKLKWFAYCSMALFIFCLPRMLPLFASGLRHRRPQQALKARRRRLGEHTNTGRWQVFAAVGSWGIDNYIIVSHSVPTRTCLNVISTAGSHSCLPWKPPSTCAQTSWVAPLGPAACPTGQSSSGSAGPWPGYCCLW